MGAHQELAQAHIDELNKITTNSTLTPSEKTAEIFKHATGAIHHNHENKIINKSAKTALKNLKKQKTKINKQEIDALINLSTESAYNKKVSGENSTAKTLWETGETNSVYVRGVTTKYHIVKATNSTEPRANSRLVMFFPGRSEPMETYKELVMEVNRLGFDALVFGFTGNGDTGRAGHISTFADYTNGASRIMREQQQKYSNITTIAHSTGATIFTRVIEEAKNKEFQNIDQAFFASPMFGIPMTHIQEKAVAVADGFLSFIGWAINGVKSRLGYVRPSQPDAIYISSKEKYYAEGENNYSQSPRRYREMERLREEYELMPPTVSWVNNANHATKKALEEASAYQKAGIKTTVFLAGAEGSVDNEATKEFISKTNSTEVEVPGSLHTMLQEADPYRAPMVTRILQELGNIKTNGTDTENL